MSEEAEDISMAHTMTTVSFRVSVEKADEYREALKFVKFTNSEFLRGVIRYFTKELKTKKEREEFLKKLGFTKKTTWVIPKGEKTDE